MNKMVINHLDKLFVTNDAATIVNELEVQHLLPRFWFWPGRLNKRRLGMELT